MRKEQNPKTIIIFALALWGPVIPGLVKLRENGKEE